MLKFNELRIDRDKNLIIDFEILDVDRDYYDTITITNIRVGIGSNEHYKEYADFLGTSGVFDRVDSWQKTVKTSPLAEEETVTIYRGFRLVIPLADDSPNNPWRTDDGYILQDPYKYLDWINVIVSPMDYRAEMETCLQESQITGYAYDRCLLVNNVFDYIKSTDNPCVDYSGYANYIVQIRGLEIAIEAGNFPLANKYWNRFFMHNKALVSNHCCCR